MTEKRLFNIREAASYLGLSPRTLYNSTAPKSKNPINIRIRRIGKKVLFDRTDLDRFIENL